jgi:hypothetical protein
MHTLDKGKACSSEANTSHPLVRGDKDYDRKGSVAKKKKSLVVNLKGLGAKLN